jgi:hypothetical protein
MMTSINNRNGEGMKVDFDSVTTHIQQKQRTCRDRLMYLMDKESLNFAEQNQILAEFQASVRSIEVLEGRTNLDGRPVIEAVGIVDVEAVNNALGRTPPSLPSRHFSTSKESKEKEPAATV